MFIVDDGNNNIDSQGVFYYAYRVDYGDFRYDFMGSFEVSMGVVLPNEDYNDNYISHAPEKSIKVGCNDKILLNCATEGENCNCDEDKIIYYGAKKDMTLDVTQNYASMTASQDITPCSSDEFGDPLPNVPKECWCEKSPYSVCSST